MIKQKVIRVIKNLSTNESYAEEADSLSDIELILFSTGAKNITLEEGLRYQLREDDKNSNSAYIGKVKVDNKEDYYSPMISFVYDLVK